MISIRETYLKKVVKQKISRASNTMISGFEEAWLKKNFSIKGDTEIYDSRLSLMVKTLLGHGPTA